MSTLLRNTKSAVSSRSFTSSGRDDGHSQKYSASAQGQFKFDVKNLVKRPMTSSPYEMTARYRMSCAPPRRVKSGVISRRRRRTMSSALSECQVFGRNLASAADSVDLEREFPDDYDYDAEDDNETNHVKSVTGSHSQMLYLRMCKHIKVTPNSYIFRNLVNEKLDLKHHLLGPEGVRSLCVALIENSSVTSLDMEDNDLGKEGAKCVAEMMQENTFVIELNLSHNNIRSEGAKDITSIIKDMDVIIKLELSGNNLQDYDGVLIRDLIEECRNLKELKVSHNFFRETGGIAIGDAIGWNDTLEVLDLSWNHLRRQGARTIASGLAINQGLREVNLAWNGFYLDGCKELGNALERNSTLEVLDLTANRINEECLRELLRGLKQNQSLRVLKLANNPITSAGAVYLLQQLLQLKESGIKEVDFGDQSVEPGFLVALKQLQDVRDVTVKFGAVLKEEVEFKDEERQLMNENPVVVLMEFGRLLDLRLVDLFSMMEKDGSRTLTQGEIKTGLLSAGIPLSEKSLDLLIKKLDTDGDGEVNYRELIAGNQERQHNMTGLTSHEQNVNQVDNEVGRVRLKLKRLMENREKLKQRPKSGASLLKGKTDTVVIPSLKPAPTGEGLNSSIPGIGVKLQPVHRLKTLV